MKNNNYNKYWIFVNNIIRKELYVLIDLLVWKNILIIIMKIHKVIYLYLIIMILKFIILMQILKIFKIYYNNLNHNKIIYKLLQMFLHYKKDYLYINVI